MCRTVQNAACDYGSSHSSSCGQYIHAVTVICFIHVYNISAGCYAVRNLLPIEGDSDNSADPYLKIYILPERSSSSKRKSSVIQNNLNPVFDET